MTDPFAPADGVKSRKMHCVDLILSLEPDSQIPYSEVMDLLDCDRTAAYAAMRDAAEYLEKEKQQSVETQKSFGWVVIDCGTAMHKKGKRRSKRIVTASVRAAGTRLAVERELLAPFDKQEHDQEVQNISKVAEIRSRKPRSLAEIQRLANANKREIPEQRVRQIAEKRRREGA